MKKNILGVLIAILCMLSIFTTGVSVAQDKEVSRIAPDGTKQLIPYNAEDLRDPFAGYLDENAPVVQPVVEPELPLPAVSVQGIIWGGKVNQAIVDGQVLKVGDTIAGVKIAEIDKDGIKVLFQNKLRNFPAPSVSDKLKGE